jgi:hypothetical protein
MADLRVPDKELQSLRSFLHDACLRIEAMPNPRAGCKLGTASYEIARRLIRKINLALKRIHGHDCSAEFYAPDRREQQP